MSITLRILLDLDDTQMPTGYRYNHCIWECGTIISAALGIYSPHPNDVLDLQAKIDIGLIQERGYILSRFPESWIMTYHRLIDERNLRADPDVERRLYHAAEQFHTGAHAAFAGVHETLEFLRSEGHELFLITAGIAELQERKLMETGLATFFPPDRRFIVNGTKGEVMAKIVHDCRARSVMVGDSMSSDIQPAVNLGIKTIKLPSSSWAFHAATSDIRPDLEITHFTELPTALEQLFPELLSAAR